jgi:hypothetical protein
MATMTSRIGGSLRTDNSITCAVCVKSSAMAARVRARRGQAHSKAALLLVDLHAVEFDRASSADA